MISRRDLLRRGPLAAIAWPTRKNQRNHHQDQVLYTGPIELPEEVRRIAGEAPTYRTTSRHYAIRFRTTDGITWVMREYAGVAHPVYIGEICRTKTNHYRVHVWRTVDRPGLEPLAFIEKDNQERQSHSEGVPETD